MNEPAVNPNTPATGVAPTPSRWYDRPGAVVLLLLVFVVLNVAGTAAVFYVLLRGETRSDPGPTSATAELTKLLAQVRNEDGKGAGKPDGARAKDEKRDGGGSKAEKPPQPGGSVFPFHSVVVLPLEADSNDETVQSEVVNWKEAMPKLIEKLTDLKVVAAEPVASLKEAKDPRKVGRELKAGAVLCGRASIDRSDGKVLDLYLLEVETGQFVWEQRFLLAPIRTKFNEAAQTAVREIKRLSRGRQ